MVRELMAKRPEQRYQTPAALAVDLDGVLCGRAVMALPARRSSLSVSETSQTVLITDNPFAQLSQSETAAGGATMERGVPATPGGVRRPTRAWVLALAGSGAVLAIALIVTAVLLLRGDRPTSNPDEPELTFPGFVMPTAQELAAAGQRRRKQEAEAEKHRAEDAEVAFKQLQTKFNEPGVAFVSFAKEVAAFKAKHNGTPAAVRA